MCKKHIKIIVDFHIYYDIMIIVIKISVDGKPYKTVNESEYKMKKTENATTKKNATANNDKKNEFLSIDKIEKLFDELTTAQTKLELVNALNRYGLRTTTIPTTTPNKNDLYIQLFDKSRILFSAKSMKVYTNETHATALNEKFEYVFDKVNDGSYRTRRTTINKTVENFKQLFEYFASNGCIEKLPQTV